MSEAHGSQRFSELAPKLFDGDRVATVSLPSGRLPSYIKDHRKRLRQRFLSGGAEAIPDYEMLELVLFRAVPRQDVKPLARRLLDAFNDFSGVVSAAPNRLAEIHGVGEAVLTELKIVEAAAHRLARVKVLSKPIISSWDAVVSYCRTSMSHRDTEQFRVLFLDRKNVLIADEALGVGTVDHVPVYPREIVKRALELNACAVVLVHNHPSGDPTPSDSDIAMTNTIVAAAEIVGITVHDHLIVGKTDELSFRSHGLL